MARGKYKKKRMRKIRRGIFLNNSGLSARVVHVLAEHEIRTLADLDDRTIEELASYAGIGDKALEEIKMVKCIKAIELHR